MEQQAGTPIRFIVMRTEVLTDKSLSISEKLVYARICSFDTYFESCELCAEMLGISVNTVRKAKTKLEKNGYIAVIKDTGHGKIYCPIFDAVRKKRAAGAQKTRSRCAKNADIEERENKDRYSTKVLGSEEPVENSEQVKEEYGNSDINSLLEYMEAQTKLPCKRDKKNRYACYNLLRKYGDDGVRKLVQGVVKAQTDRFAPKITNYVQLQAKLPELLLWGRQQSQLEAPTAKPKQTDAKSAIERLYGAKKGMTYEEALEWKRAKEE